MVGILNYKIFPDKKLIIECIRGIVHVDEFIQLKSCESHDQMYNSTYNVFVDLLGSEPKVRDAELHHLVRYFKNNPSFFERRNVAVLTDSPNQVVTTELFNLYYKKESTNLKIASTLYTAIQWVGLSPNDAQFIIDTIKELTLITTLNEYPGNQEPGMINLGSKVTVH